MTLLLASVLLALLAAGWTVVPLLTRRGASLADVAAGDVLDADARRKQALASLREAEFDFAAGKLDAADYQVLRTQLQREAVVALHAAKRLGAVAAVAASAGGIHRCGFTNPAGSRFCGGCGGALA